MTALVVPALLGTAGTVGGFDVWRRDFGDHTDPLPVAQVYAVDPDAIPCELHRRRLVGGRPAVDFGGGFRPRLGEQMNRLAALLDGGMGTLLQDEGLEGGAAGELWNVERPDVIRSCHDRYAVAGATILTTNTFGGSRPRLEMHGLADGLHELNQAPAEIAHAVAQEHSVLAAGGLGPAGELMAPLGRSTTPRRRASSRNSCAACATAAST